MNDERHQTIEQSVTNCNGLGNAAKMREALDKIYNKLETLDVEEDSYADEIIASVKSDIVDALFAPPRNCDMYATLDDARNSFFTDYVSDETCSSATAFSIWLFDKAKGDAK